MKSRDLQNISVAEEERSVSYALTDDRLFFETSFKMLAGVGKEYFVPCARSRWNGHVKLTYFTRGLRPFDQVMGGLAVPRLAAVLASLTRVIQDIPSTGFLSANDVDLDERHIFVDPETFDVRVVYLPLTASQQGGSTSADQDLVALIGREISPGGTTPFALRDVANYIQAGRITYDELIGLLNRVAEKGDDMMAQLPDMSGLGASGSLGNANGVPQQVRGYRLMPQRVPGARPVDITAQETVLGKSGMADVSVPYSNAIGRTHCRMYLQQGRLGVMDLQSRNGTYVNGRRVSGSSQTPLREGDVLRLADVDFVVQQLRGV